MRPSAIVAIGRPRLAINSDALLLSGVWLDRLKCGNRAGRCSAIGSREKALVNRSPRRVFQPLPLHESVLINVSRTTCQASHACSGSMSS